MNQVALVLTFVASLITVVCAAIAVVRSAARNWWMDEASRLTHSIRGIEIDLEKVRELSQYHTPEEIEVTRRVLIDEMKHLIERRKALRQIVLPIDRGDAPRTFRSLLSLLPKSQREFSQERLDFIAEGLEERADSRTRRSMFLAREYAQLLMLVARGRLGLLRKQPKKAK